MSEQIQTGTKCTVCGHHWTDCGRTICPQRHRSPKVRLVVDNPRPNRFIDFLIEHQFVLAFAFWVALFAAYFMFG